MISASTLFRTGSEVGTHRHIVPNGFLVKDRIVLNSLVNWQPAREAIETPRTRKGSEMKPFFKITQKAGDSTEGFVTISNACSTPDLLIGAFCPIAQTTDLVGAHDRSLLYLRIPARRHVTLEGPLFLRRRCPAKLRIRQRFSPHSGKQSTFFEMSEITLRSVHVPYLENGHKQ